MTFMEKIYEHGKASFCKKNKRLITDNLLVKHDKINFFLSFAYHF